MARNHVPNAPPVRRVDDLDATLEELRRRDVQAAFRVIEDRSLGHRTFAIRDNAGNFIQFYGT